MKRLNRDELLKWLDLWSVREIPVQKQAYEQIKELIMCEDMVQQYRDEKEAEQAEIELTYIDIVLDLYDRLEKKSPRVTEEFVRKWADVIHQADTSLFGIKGELKLIRQMLKEAGVEAVGR